MSNGKRSRIWKSISSHWTRRTTSSRCIVFDREERIVAMAQKETTQFYPQAGWVEQDPMEI